MVGITSVWQPGKRLLLFGAAVFLGAALLAPGVYHFVNAFWPVPFHRCVHRALLVAALAASPLLLAGFPWRRSEAWGLAWNADSSRELLGGVALGVFSIGLAVGMHLVWQTRTWAPRAISPGQWGAILLAVLLVPLVEEPLFRGLLQKRFVQWLGSFWGLLLGGVVFAFVHFIRVPGEWVDGPVHWWSGFPAVGQGLRVAAHAVRFDGTDWHFAALLIAGLILGGTALRRGNLWMAIGLHAGWIAGIKLGGAWTQAGPAHPLGSGGGDLIGSITTIAALNLVTLVLIFLPTKPLAMKNIP